MLVREALEICQRLGQEGMDGDLSIVDSDHFDKLKHFYEKLGFSVIFYSPGDPDYRISRVGKIDIKFEMSRRAERSGSSRQSGGKRAALEGLFKALLHKLMTGEITVRELNLPASVED